MRDRDKLECILRTIPVTWGGETGVEIIDPSIPSGQTTMRLIVHLQALAQRQDDMIVPYYRAITR